MIVVDESTELVGTGLRRVAGRSLEGDCTIAVEAGKPWTVIYTGRDSGLVVDRQGTVDAEGGRAPLLRPEEAPEGPYGGVLDPEAQDKGVAWAADIAGHTVGSAPDTRRRVVSGPDSIHSARCSNP